MSDHLLESQQKVLKIIIPESDFERIEVNAQPDSYIKDLIDFLFDYFDIIPNDEANLFKQKNNYKMQIIDKNHTIEEENLNHNELIYFHIPGLHFIS